jgi:hypothetical protein
MSKFLSLVPRMAFFVAGVAAGALVGPRKERTGGDSADVRDLKTAVSNLESRIAAQEAANANRLTQIETRLDEHAGKLAEIPSTSQIVSAMEHLLAKTMSSLDERLTSQAHSIDLLKTTVSQTDGLLERVLESLDSLQNEAESPEMAEELLLRRPVR